MTTLQIIALVIYAMVAAAAYATCLWHLGFYGAWGGGTVDELAIFGVIGFVICAAWPIALALYFLLAVGAWAYQITHRGK